MADEITTDQESAQPNLSSNPETVIIADTVDDAVTETEEETTVNPEPEGTEPVSDGHGGFRRMAG